MLPAASASAPRSFQSLYCGLVASVIETPEVSIILNRPLRSRSPRMTDVKAREAPASPPKSAMAKGIWLAPAPVISMVSSACAGVCSKATAVNAMRPRPRSFSRGRSMVSDAGKIKLRLYRFG